MNKINRRIHIDSSNFLDIILILILIAIILSMIYSFFEPQFVSMNNKKHIVSDIKTIDELKQCADKYFDALIYEKVYIVNEMQTFFNQKSIDEIKKIKDTYGDSLSYDLIVKHAYKQGNNVYLCDIEVTPEIDKDKYDWQKTKTAKIIVKLNKNNNTFKIFDDEFNVNLEVSK